MSVMSPAAESAQKKVVDLGIQFAEAVERGDLDAVRVLAKALKTRTSILLQLL